MNTMRRRTGAIASMIGLVLAFFGTTAAPALGEKEAKTRQLSQVYLAGTGFTVDCDQLYGGACFPMQGDEIEAAIGVVDDLGRQPASARYEFRDSTGTVLETATFCDSTTASVPAGASELAVMVAAFDPVSCGGVATGSTGKIHVLWKISEGELLDFDIQPQVCLQPTPTAISVGGVTEPEDLDQRITLDVLVLLDGVHEQRGRDVMEKAAEAYTPLGIDMRFSYRAVSLEQGTGQLMLSYSMSAVGGEVPKGFDVVHTLTSKKLNVGGQADCIGGVRYRDRAFSVSTNPADRPIQYIGSYVPGRMIDNYAAKIAAHEIGHTMGGHHHYGTCAAESAVATGEPQSCTIMVSPAPFPTELMFSTVNAAIVRAHAVRYASP